jgi:hypothetical protein
MQTGLAFDQLWMDDQQPCNCFLFVLSLTGELPVSTGTALHWRNGIDWPRWNQAEEMN